MRMKILPVLDSKSELSGKFLGNFSSNYCIFSLLPCYLSIIRDDAEMSKISNAFSIFYFFIRNILLGNSWLVVGLKTVVSLNKGSIFFP